MPNRIIKDSIHTSETVNALTDFQFRLWVNLITYVDDYGRGDARPAVIKGTCFPLRDRLTIRDIEAALKALAGAGCVGLYEVDGKPYLYFPTWESHQRIRQKVSKYPAPPSDMTGRGESRRVAADCGELPPESESRIQNPESESRRGYARARTRFIPPTVDEVQAYAAEKGYSGFSAERFVAFYESKGWMVGKNAMKSWKAAVSGWVSRSDTGRSTGQTNLNPALDYQQRDFKAEDYGDGFFIDLDHYGEDDA